MVESTYGSGLFERSNQGATKMEKLEEIFLAEEAARHAVDAARERAREIHAEAVGESDLIVSSAARESADEGRELRAGILREADAAAAAAERGAEAELARVVASAETRLDSAATHIISELVG